MNIFTLTGTILVDSTKAEMSISKTVDKAQELGNKLKDGIKTAGKWAAGLAAGATAVGGAMVALAKDTAATADQIDKASQRMGISAEALQTLTYQAELSGVSMGTLEKAAKKLDGITLEDAMAQIYALETAEERATKASELFGDAVAYDMTPLLNASAADMAAMAEEAQNLGLIMSNEAVAGGAAMGDQFAKLEKTFGALKTQIAAELMPYMIKLLDWALENVPKMLTKVTETVTGIKNVIGGLIDWIREKYEWAMSIVARIKSVVSEVRDTEDVGTHAAGLNYVPYDGYKAELHKGEMVVNATSTQNIAEDIINGLKDHIGGNNAPINISLEIDGREFARATYTYNKGEASRRGSSLVVV